MGKELTRNDITRRILVDARGCWIWQANLNNQGYGQMRQHGLMHRAAYRLWNGPIPARAQIHHTCNRKNCVNPDHLKAISRSGNQHYSVVDRHGQMSWRQLRVAQWLHDLMTERAEAHGR